jgi:hypothetical protein
VVKIPHQNAEKVAHKPILCDRALLNRELRAAGESQ